MATYQFINNNAPQRGLFAFNKNVVRVWDAPAGATLMTMIGIRNFGEDEYQRVTDTREVGNDGVCYIDIAPYLQQAFSDANVTSRYETTAKQCIIFMWVDSVPLFEPIETHVIYGLLAPNDTFCPRKRKVRWFTNFPMRLSLYASIAGRMDVTFADGTSYYYELQEGMNNFTNPITQDTTISYTTAYNYERQADIKKVKTGSISQSHIDIVTDDSDCGTFVRWLDRHGFWQYWLFKETKDALASASYGETLPLPAEAGTIIDVFRSQGRVTTESVSLAQPYVDRETFKFLSGIIGSPFVSVYNKEYNEWQPVSVTTSSVAWVSDKSHKNYQDFEIACTFSAINSQRI